MDEHHRSSLPLGCASRTMGDVGRRVLTHAAPRCRDRPRHHQHPLHPVRPCGRAGRGLAVGAPADLPPPGVGRARRAEIWRRTGDVVRGAMGEAGATAADVAAVGITNQRETTVVWDRRTGQPLHHAIVWQDTRTKDLCDALAQGGGQDRFRPTTGLPLATYFAGPKLRWLLDHVPGLRAAAERGDALFGTVDSWLIWNLTGGPDGGGSGRRQPRHRRDQRRPHDADGPPHPRLGRGHAAGDEHPPADAAADRAVARRPGVGHHPPGRPVRRRGAGVRLPRRPARGYDGPGLLRPRRVEEHLRHRLLHAAAHRRAAGRQLSRPAHDRRVQAGRRPGVLRAGGVGGGGRVARPVAAGQPRADRRLVRDRVARPRGADNGGVYFVPRSPGCSPRTGGATPAGRSSG
jgi:hypothetical protein